MLYFFFVFSMVRDLASHYIATIWMDDLPHVDRIWKLCQELKIATELKYYELETHIVETLVFILRSREIVIKVTRDPDLRYEPTFILLTTRNRGIETDSDNQNRTNYAY